ncbi:metallophosphoesterase [Paenibacillus caseinilyticus]|nr:metallophosphoesterase [Paenibacillus mucilaginosus]WFA18092.1 metallophosphoesterase [Paenibacillus mucilaginosus]
MILQWMLPPGYAEAAALFADREEPICFGHYHPVHFFGATAPLFLNPGSLGCNHQPLARLALVEVDDKGTLELMAAGCDNTGFLRSYDVLQVPDGS